MKSIGQQRSLLNILLTGVLCLSLTPMIASAATTLPPTVIDDFEDGDSSDWIFFGGNAAGGGGGVQADRPQEGGFYLDTGWGGQGTASNFYGGAFRNFDDGAQVALPADPWFNVWVYNQSDASADQYTLEITLREDLNGNGWTNGAEDSIRLATTFTSTEFNDEWLLVSAPLSSFVNSGTGGNGTFDGNLDEVVIVIAGVQGANPSVVEVDFDQFSFTSGGPIVLPTIVLFDDMEHGNPSANGWFSFNGAGGGGIAANATDLPPEDGGAFSLDTGWGSGGTPGFFGGFGRTNPVDLSGTDKFSFWINPDAGQDYILEINLQDDDNGDNAANAPDDDEFQYNCAVSPTGPCAISGGGWQRVSIPLADFFDDNSFFTGGNGVLDAVATSRGGNGQLINIVLAIISNSGADVSFRTDYWVFSEDPSVIIDDFESGLPSGLDGDGNPIGFYTFSDGSPIAIVTTDAPPAPVPGSSAGNSVLAMTGNVAAFAGFIHGFENDAVDTWVTQDWLGSEGFSVWFYGQNTGTQIFIDVLDNRNPGSTVDDAERFTVAFVDDFTGWQLLEFPFSTFVRKEIGNGAPNDGFGLTEVHGWALGSLATPGETTFYVDDAMLYGVAEVPDLSVSFSSGGFDIEEGTTGTITVELNRPMNSDDPAQVSVDYFTEPGTAIPGRDYTPLAGTLTFVNGGPSELSFPMETFDNSKFSAPKSVTLRLSNPVDVVAGLIAQSTAFIINNDLYDPNLLDDFEDFPYLWDSDAGTTITNLVLTPGDPLARPGQDNFEGVLRAESQLGVPTRFSQDFPIGRDWSGGEGLTFWYYGTGSGDPVTVHLKDNRAPDPGPAGWGLVWSEEFNEPAGTVPNPANWRYEIGDGNVNGLRGWGNDERQYYTDDPDNAATDGSGNMVLTVRDADGSLQCYYGPCEYTSARLISKRRAEFAYGRIESRILVPQGAGIWPAFWSLGTDVDVVSWPQTGEIDFMEFVGRIPNEIFGTIHGPGYSGGNSFGNVYDFGVPVFNDYHTYAVEWEPDSIKWYVDGILYHSATPADVAPNEWVFNDPVYLLLNVAMGGNFGGAVDPNFMTPQSMAVDYIRVYQAPDTAERFETTFVDDFVGWQQVEVPFTGFARSADQPAGAPDDGLNLTEVWGYGFELPQGGTMLLDEVKLKIAPAPLAIIVTNVNDSGPGSLRLALEDIGADGIITFDPALAGETIALTSGQLPVDRSVTIDASAVPGIVVSGSNSSRVFTVAAGVTAGINDLVVADGAGALRGGGILNLGTLNLDRVVVTDNVETSGGAASFDLGGGGIYNGDGATLNLTDSTVSNNATVNQPGGGIYAFFNTTVNIERSTISNNVGADVAGGLRTLGDLTVLNSTISGNVSTLWHGGAAFITDGTAVITNSTITDNFAPAGTAGGLMVATFGAPVSLTVTNSIVADNGTYDCQVEGGGAAVLTSGGNNVLRDGSCSPVASDIIVADPLLGPLADNGGPTLTQALLPGSPAIDAAGGANCPASDQRGVLRPQGAGCDAGAFERVQQVNGPVDLAARAKSGKVQLTWTPLQGAATYSVYRGETAGGPYDLIAANHVTSYATYLDENVTNGTTYYYVVTGTVVGVESGPSNEASATPNSRRRR